MSVSLAGVDGRSRINYSVKTEFLSKETVLTKDTLSASVKVSSFSFCERLDHLYQQHADLYHRVYPAIRYILGDKIASPYIHNDISWFWSTVLLTEVLPQILFSQIFVWKVFSEICFKFFSHLLESWKSLYEDYHNMLLYNAFVLSSKYVLYWRNVINFEDPMYILSHIYIIPCIYYHS